MAILWNVAQCGLVETDRRSEVLTAFNIRVMIGLMMEALSTFEAP
jgi:hypothetical protein